MPAPAYLVHGAAKGPPAAAAGRRGRKNERSQEGVSVIFSSLSRDYGKKVPVLLLHFRASLDPSMCGVSMHWDIAAGRIDRQAA